MTTGSLTACNPWHDLLWFASGADLAVLAPTCQTAAKEVASHPCWELLTLCEFGDDHGDPDPACPAEWQRLCMHLTRLRASLLRSDSLGHGTGRAEAEIEPLLPNHVGGPSEVCLCEGFDPAAPACLDLRWTLVLPGAECSAGGVVWYDGATCRLLSFQEGAEPRVLWQEGSKPGLSNGVAPRPLRAAVARDRFYLLAHAQHIDAFSHDGEALGTLPAPAGCDLLAQATDLFIAGGGRLVVVEMALQVLVWDVQSRTLMCSITHKGADRLQSRPAGRGTLAVWPEDNGDEVLIWQPLPLAPRLVGRCSLARRRPGRLLVNTGICPRLGLLCTLDNANEFHLAFLPAGATDGRLSACSHQGCRHERVQESCSGAPSPGPAEESQGGSDGGSMGGPDCKGICSLPLRLGRGRKVLPCSVTLRGGIFSFVEATDLDDPFPCLHCWILLEGTRVLEEPRRLSFHFTGHGSPTVCVPRPCLRRFVFLRSCSIISSQRTLVRLQVFDLARGRCIYVRRSAVHDSSLFRRAHPSVDGVVALWTAAPGGGSPGADSEASEGEGFDSEDSLSSGCPEHVALAARLLLVDLGRCAKMDAPQQMS